MPQITIQLEHANKTNFVEVAEMKPEKVYKVRLGVPYWLYNSKGDIEPVNYITNVNTSFDELKIYFERKQILTIKKNE